MARYEDLPYRTCVGMMLINPEGLVFIGRRAGGIEHVDESHVWQMPQGGKNGTRFASPAGTTRSMSRVPAAAATRRSS